LIKFVVFIKIIGSTKIKITTSKFMSHI